MLWKRLDMLLRQVRWRENVSTRGFPYSNFSIIILAAKNVRHFIKTTGSQVAKVGLKSFQTAGEAVGKAAAFIPGVGLPVGEAMNEVSSVAGSISDRTNVQLPSKWQTGLNITNSADQIMNY